MTWGSRRRGRSYGRPPVRRPHPGPAGLGRRWLAGLVALLLLAGIGWLAPAGAARAEPQVSVDVFIDTVTLKGTKPESQVILRGRVINSGSLPAFGLHLVMWRAPEPITQRSSLTNVVSGTTTPWGEQLPASLQHNHHITDSETPFPPGGTHNFVVRATLAELGFYTRGAAYTTGVQALATPDASSRYTVVGRARTFVVLPPKKKKATVRATPLIVLSATPSQLRRNLFAHDRLATELTQRLRKLLNAARQSGMSYVIDPALLEAVQDMSDGYSVNENGQLRPGVGQEIAKQWLADFEALPTTDAFRSLYANPDVAGAARAKDRSVTSRATTATQSYAELKAYPLLVLPAWGTVDARTLDYVDSLNAAGIVAANVAGKGALLTGGKRTPILQSTSSVTQVGPLGDVSPANRVQRQLADALLSGNLGAVRVIVTEQDLATDRQATPSWVRRQGLNDLLDTNAGKLAGITKPLIDTGLSRDQLRDLKRINRDFDAYAELATETTLTSQVPAILSRGASSWWIDNPAARSVYLDEVSDQVDPQHVAASVRLTASPRFVMSSRTNEFPVTITNDLPEPVRLRVVLTSDNPQRLTVPSSKVVTVAPGQSQTVNVRPEASSNGLVLVQAHAATQEGRRVTPSTRITVEITELGMIGWIIVFASGIVLIATTALRIRQVRRAEAAKGAA